MKRTLNALTASIALTMCSIAVSAAAGKLADTYNPGENTYTTVCDIGSAKVTLEYPNPAGSANWMKADHLKLISIEVNGRTIPMNLPATQVYLARFHGPNSYGNGVSAKFVDDQANLILDMNSYTQILSFQSTGTKLDGKKQSGVCLLGTGE